MKVNLYSVYRTAVGKSSFVINLPDQSSIFSAIQEITNLFPVLKHYWLTDKGELYSHLNIYVNGHDIMTLPGEMQTILSSQDSLDFFPPVAGGDSLLTWLSFQNCS